MDEALARCAADPWGDGRVSIHAHQVVLGCHAAEQ
jgi:hypothetical protein